MARIDPANLIGGVLVMGIGGVFAVQETAVVAPGQIAVIAVAVEAEAQRVERFQLLDAQLHLGFFLRLAGEFDEAIALAEVVGSCILSVNSAAQEKDEQQRGDAEVF